MCSQCEGTKERSKAYLAYRQGVKDGRESPDNVDWQAFQERANGLHPAYRKGFEDGYNDDVAH